MPELQWVSEDVFLVREFLSPHECAHWIATAEAIGFEAASISTRSGPEMRPDIRNNRRVIYDAPELAEALWPRLRQFVPLRRGEWHAVGLNERFRFYKYEVGQQFEWHHDGLFKRENGERNFFTLLLYLNQDDVGGETSFAEHSAVPQLPGGQVRPETGMALLFRRQMLHKGETVASGCKYVLRSDVMYQVSGVEENL
ncbi:prolyl hydroxylase family protein [Blastopirellula marina]|uniref:Fe2OG dioxygenase domain-containing protein n=1 Tax=Blastopirellula marina TaxID=124 RepID=A0A2S8GGX8_9BACT|nr:2OG-Fe(II) oxygenase [Blastopirellula marina]PQO43531.1 hypothetical protein C5Y93_23045 [Blastopirellula marina]